MLPRKREKEKVKDGRMLEKQQRDEVTVVALKEHQLIISAGCCLSPCTRVCVCARPTRCIPTVHADSACYLIEP